MANEFGRSTKDVLLRVTKALPGTSATNTSDALDIGINPLTPEDITVEVSLPAMPLHVTAGNTLTITLYHGDTSSLAATATALGVAITCTQIGIVTDGTAAQVFRFKLPPGVKRYIGFFQSAGGTDDLSSYTATYSLLV